ncbi:MULTISPECIES: translocation/assembly module TamB domain-containing protein [unclassified Carboxylicivirga]|uniref:translocation/assembly module TamB domain-containing protein n=1 Tax=Carboxylicivirga TaxID=1628153 RepID=UPI003D34F7F0
MVNYITGELSEDLNTEISIGRVHLRPFKKLVLDEVVIFDQQQDTLVSVGRLAANIDSVFFKQKRLYISSLGLQDPQIGVVKYDSTYNYNFLIDALKIKQDTMPVQAWQFRLTDLDLLGGHLSYKEDSLPPKVFFSDINVALHNIARDSIWHFDIEDFNFDNRLKGLSPKGVSGRVQLSNTALHLLNAKAHTAYSSCHIDSLSVNFIAGQQGLDQLGDFYVKLHQSHLSARDIVQVTELNRATNLALSGEVYGRLDNIKGRNVRLDFGQYSNLLADFDISGLPHLDETFIYLGVKRLKTSPDDLSMIFSHVRGRALQLPAAIGSLDDINYRGSFTGFLTDLVAYGEFSTALGNISTDLGLKIDEEDNLLFSGQLSTRQFDIGRLAGAEKHIGKTSMSVSIKGRRSSKDDFNAYLSGIVDTLRVNNYDYKNIRLNGLFANKKFDGDFLIDDPNGQLGFNGKIDLSGAVPNFRFAAKLTELRLDRLNLLNKHRNSVLTADIKTDISGADMDDLVGYLNVKGFHYQAEGHDVSVDSLLLVSVREEERKRLVLQSDIAEGDLVGHYNFTHIGNRLKQNLMQFLPSLKRYINIKDKVIKENDFTFSCTLKEMADIVALFEPEMDISDKGLLLGSYDSQAGKMDLEAGVEYLNYKGISLVNPEVHLVADDNEKLLMITRMKELNLGSFGALHNLSLHHTATHDTLQMNLFWNNWDEYTNSGSIMTTTALKDRNNGFYATTELHPSYIMVRDSLWEMQPTRLHMHPDGFSTKNFRVHHGNQEIGVNGFVHRHVKDGLRIHLQNINLAEIVGYQGLKQVEIAGALSGVLDIHKLYTSPIISGNIHIDDFHFNKDRLGDFVINADYLPQDNQVRIGTTVTKDGASPLQGGGIIDLANQQLYLNYDLDKLEIGFLNLYLSKVMQNLSGTASGEVSVAGSLSRPALLGKVNIDKAFFDVGLLQTSYSISDSVFLEANTIRFKELKIADRNNRQGSFSGTIVHDAFRDMRYDLKLIANNMLVLDTKYSDNQLYYGEVYADGNLSVSGTTKDLVIDIAGQTKPNTQFFIPLSDEESAEESNFIRFVKHDIKGDENEVPDIATSGDYEIDLKGMTVSMDLDITPDARCQVIFDSTVGDILRGAGNGNLQIKMDKEGGINFFGDFSFDEGDYMFTLQNVLNKKFVINPGSSIHWDGNPYDAIIDLNATYRLKTSLNDLMPTPEEGYSRRIPVNCNLLLTDRLTRPNVQFEIITPSEQDNNQNVIDAFINTEEELNRQVLSLLVLNRFYSQESQAAGSSGSNLAGNNAALVTTTEMLSNQLSHWLSQISRDVDIGVSYRPASEMTDDEVEVALSTQIFNNRVIVNGNVGYMQDQTRPSNLIGDFDVEVKLNKSGSLRAKAYTKTNNDLFYSTNTSPTTQGVGFSFKEEFDTLEELMHKYWMKLSGRAKKAQETEDEEEVKD